MVLGSQKRAGTVKWLKHGLYALGNNVIPKFGNFFTIIIIIQLYSIEALAPYYKAVAYFALLQIFSQCGIPAQYQREKLVKMDEKKVNKLLTELDMYSLLGTLALFFFFIAFYDRIQNTIIYILIVVCILPAARLAFYNSYLMKLQLHNEIFFVSSIVSTAVLFSTLSVFALSFFGIDIDPIVIISILFITPIILRFFIYHRIIRKKIRLSTLNERLVFAKPIKRRKIWGIRLTELVRTLVSSSTTSLILIYASTKLTTSDFALLGLLSSWVNRTYLIFVSSFKQIMYPIFVNLRNQTKNASDYLLWNYKINFLVGILISFVVYLISKVYFISLVNAISIYFVFAVFNYSISPFNDRIKSFGAFNILLQICLVQGLIASAFFFYLEFIFYGSPVLEIFIIGLLLIGIFNHLTVLIFFKYFKKLEKTKT